MTYPMYAQSGPIEIGLAKDLDLLYMCSGICVLLYGWSHQVLIP